MLMVSQLAQEWIVVLGEMRKVFFWLSSSIKKLTLQLGRSFVRTSTWWDDGALGNCSWCWLDFAFKIKFSYFLSLTIFNLPKPQFILAFQFIQLLLQNLLLHFLPLLWVGLSQFSACLFSQYDESPPFLWCEIFIQLHFHTVFPTLRVQFFCIWLFLLHISELLLVGLAFASGVVSMGVLIFTLVCFVASFAFIAAASAFATSIHHLVTKGGERSH